MGDEECRKDSKNLFKKSESIYKSFYHIVFLEICQSFGLLPKGLVSKKGFCIEHPSKEFTEEWRSSIKDMDNKCRDLLLQEHCKKLFLLMDSFWDEIKDFNFHLKWLFKVRNHLEKFERKLQETKRKKISNLSKNAEIKKLVLARFREHLPHFEFKVDFTSFCDSRCQDFDNIHTLLTLNESNNSKNESDVFFQASQNNRMEFANNIQNNAENEIRNSAENSSFSKVDNVLNESENVAMFRGNRLEGKFVSKNVINLSRRNLSSAEISLLSKGLKFVPTANKIDQAKLKRELEEYGRKLRLMWHFRNDERPFSQERFKPKSTFNPRNKDAVIETYLSCLEGRLLDIEIPSKRFNNLTKDERNAMYSLKDDKSIIIKGADKGSTVIVWDREDYIKEATKQLEDKDVYMEVPNDSIALVSTIFKSLEKIRKRGDLSQDTLNYFLVKDPKFARFYLLPKIHKRLHDVPGRPVISNCGFYTENISSFLDFHLQPLAQKVKSYIKDTNHFLKKIKELGQLPEGTILCTIDVVGLYPNIPHDEGLAFLKDFLDSRVDKQVTTDTLIELTEVVLKNNIFEFSDKTYKQIRGAAIGTKFAPPYAVLFMAALEEKILSKAKKKPSVWWRYFLFGNMVKNLFKNLSMRLIHFIRLSNLRQTGQKKKLIF